MAWVPHPYNRRHGFCSRLVLGSPSQQDIIVITYSTIPLTQSSSSKVLAYHSFEATLEDELFAQQRDRFLAFRFLLFAGFPILPFVQMYATSCQKELARSGFHYKCLILTAKTETPKNAGIKKLIMVHVTKLLAYYDFSEVIILKKQKIMLKGFQIRKTHSSFPSFILQLLHYEDLFKYLIEDRL